MTYDPNFRVCSCGTVYYQDVPTDLHREPHIPVGHVCPKAIKNLPMPPAPLRRAKPPRHRRDDKPTSIAAAEGFEEKRLTELQTRVLEFFRARKEATDEELEDALMGQVPAASTLRKRRCELVSLGYLRNSGRTRKNRNNREMVVWEVGEVGEEL
jgi:hypothetical protein